MKISKIWGAAVISACLFAVSCQSSTNENQGDVNEQQSDERLDTTKITFDTVAFDFGVVEQGQKVNHAFTFTNTGEYPLVLSSVKASCGCTVPSWTKEPVAPGQKGTVEVEFNTTGRKGIQQKTVSVFANTSPKVTLLHFTANIPVEEEKK